MCAVCVCIHMDTYTHTCMNTVRANRAETLNPMNTVRANRACLTLACAISSRTPFSRCVCPCLYVCLIYAMSVCVPDIRHVCMCASYTPCLYVCLIYATHCVTLRHALRHAAWRKRGASVTLHHAFHRAFPGARKRRSLRALFLGPLDYNARLNACVCVRRKMHTRVRACVRETGQL